MNRLEIILTNLLILLVSMSAYADYPPDVYAICEITLKSGEKMEGILEIDKGHTCGEHRHGFAKKLSISSDLMNFNPFDGPYKWDLEVGEVFFLYNESVECGGEDWTKTFKYHLDSSITIYSDLDSDERPLTTSGKIVNLRDIKTFKLIPEPSANWIQLIADRHVEPRDEAEAVALGRSGDWDWPSWFHNLPQRNPSKMSVAIINVKNHRPTKAN
ncbi:MAG: hypothetical protein H6603_03580 [Flavobacteriales bacterium]|nr:hypothetical protein [Flavobacteriales bacterium]MCB9204039.1 hypothetical protein [Flavobacteriales bacterium]